MVVIEGKVVNLETLYGVATGSTDLGTFTGDTITDNGTVKEALQELETSLEGVESAIHMGCRKVAFNHDDTFPLNIEGVIPSGAYIKEVSVKMTEIFDSALDDIEVGTSVDADLLMGTEEVNINDLGIYSKTTFEVLGADTQFIITKTGSNSTQGAGYVLIEYC